jgi:excisionase family DNA binding protein
MIASMLLRQAEFARQVGVSESTVKRWLKREELEPGTGVRYVRLPGGERRIPYSELVRILGPEAAA